MHLDLEVLAGATFDSYSFKYVEDDKVTPVNLTGYSARLQVRTLKDVLKFEVTPVLTAATGMIDFSFSAAQTGSLSEHSYIWGLELTSPQGVVRRLVEGKVLVTPEVVK